MSELKPEGGRLYLRKPDGSFQLPIPLDTWIKDRAENCERIAKGKPIGDDRNGWLEDAAYFRAVIAALPAPAIGGFDETDLDMIRRGDMLGRRLGERVFAALSALPAPATQEVDELREIKPLEWTWVEANLRYEGWEARSIAGRYWIPRVGREWQLWCDLDFDLDAETDIRMGVFSTADLAQAAAQADYEARIRSALAPADPQLHEDTARLDWLEMHYVSILIKSPNSNELVEAWPHGVSPSDLRAQIDRARAAEKDGQ